MACGNILQVMQSDIYKHLRLSGIIMLMLLIVIGIMINFPQYYQQIGLPLVKISNNTKSSHSRLPRRQFDVVLSYYKEDLSFVRRFVTYLRNVSKLQPLHPRVIVYNKNANINETYLQRTLAADKVITLENVGREGGTYLRHIVDNYDTIADHTLFSQAGVEGITDHGLADWFLFRLEHEFRSNVGFMPMVDVQWISVYNCGRHPSGHFPQLNELWGMLEQSLCPPDGQAVSFRGQFLVSRRRIHSRSLSIYQYLHHLITADKTHWIHRDRKCAPDNPIFGHVIERIWTVLFRCAKADLADRCRRSNCSCFDEY